VDHDGCRADLLAALGVPSYQEVILRAACAGLAEMKDQSAVPVLLALVNQPSSALRRVVVIGALGRLKSDDASIVARLDKELDNSRPMVRGFAVDALVKVGDPRAIELLVALRAKEKRYGRLSRAIDEALVTLRAKQGTIDELSKRVESLRGQNQLLLERVKKLEESIKK
jgi:HEAT repeat protein